MQPTIHYAIDKFWEVNIWLEIILLIHYINTCTVITHSTYETTPEIHFTYCSRFSGWIKNLPEFVFIMLCVFYPLAMDVNETKWVWFFSFFTCFCLISLISFLVAFRCTTFYLYVINLLQRKVNKKFYLVCSISWLG